MGERPPQPCPVPEAYWGHLGLELGGPWYVGGVPQCLPIPCHPQLLADALMDPPEQLLLAKPSPGPCPCADLSLPLRCAFFHGEVDKPAQGLLHRGRRKPVSVAISLEGVHIIDSREKVPWAVGGCRVMCVCLLCPSVCGGQDLDVVVCIDLPG